MQKADGSLYVRFKFQSVPNIYSVALSFCTSVYNIEIHIIHYSCSFKVTPSCGGLSHLYKKEDPHESCIGL